MEIDRGAVNRDKMRSTREKKKPICILIDFQIPFDQKNYQFKWVEGRENQFGFFFLPIFTSASAAPRPTTHYGPFSGINSHSSQ